MKWLWLRRDWLWSFNDTTSWDHAWQPVCADADLVPTAGAKLRLRPRGRAVPKGWYLFLIQHRGDNNRLAGTLLSGCWGFPQGRPMYPIRLRLRVVHVNRERPLTLELQRVAEPLRLSRLWLLRLPSWEAWRRIRRRLRRLDGYCAEKATSRWRYYNHLLNGQAGSRPLISYCRWQQEIETSLVAVIPAMSASQCRRFVLHELPQRHKARADQWMVLQRPGTALAPWALAALAYALTRWDPREAPALLYGDEDLIASSGERHSPRFKPAWNRELFWADPGFSCCWVVRGDLWNQFVDTQPSAVSTWWELQYSLLQFVERQGLNQRIRHLPMVLAHQFGSMPPGAAQALRRQFANDFGADAPVIKERNGGMHLTWACPAQTLLSVVIPTRDQLPLLKSCLQSIKDFPAGVDLELIVVDNGSKDPATLAFLEDFRRQPFQKVLRDDGPFNFSALNNRAIDVATGSVLLLLNNDVEFLSLNWGAELAANALRPGVGCVGAQLHYPDGTIQHGGVVLGIGGMASHAHRDFEVDAPGYQGRLQLAQEFSAVTAACLAISADHWRQLGGLDAELFAVNYNDVDLCLRAQQAGLRNLYLPQVKAIHHESKSRGRPQGEAYRQWRREWSAMERRWGDRLLHDPAYSPFLTLEDENWGLSLRRPALQLR